jgi:hypothetical protein
MYSSPTKKRLPRIYTSEDFTTEMQTSPRRKRKQNRNRPEYRKYRQGIYILYLSFCGMVTVIALISPPALPTGLAIGALMRLASDNFVPDMTEDAELPLELAGEHDADTL